MQIEDIPELTVGIGRDYNGDRTRKLELGFNALLNVLKESGVSAPVATQETGSFENIIADQQQKIEKLEENLAEIKKKLPSGKKSSKKAK